MTIKKLLAAAGLAAAILLTGCAAPPQKPVGLEYAKIATERPKVGVAMTAIPKPEVYLPGASCLLCIAFATAANSDLSKHAETLKLEDLPKLKEQAATVLRKRGLDVVVIPEALDVRALPDASATAPNVAMKNFSALKAKWNVDKLVVIDITQLGFERTYSAYIPTGAPKALLRGVGYMVNLTTNGYDWYQPVEISRAADGNWDEPKSSFPGLTNAYYHAVELSRDVYLKPLAN